jgi:hypothetical protein
MFPLMALISRTIIGIKKFQNPESLVFSGRPAGRPIVFRGQSKYFGVRVNEKI